MSTSRRWLSTALCWYLERVYAGGATCQAQVKGMATWMEELEADFRARGRSASSLQLALSYVTPYNWRPSCDIGDGTANR